MGLPHGFVTSVAGWTGHDALDVPPLVTVPEVVADDVDDPEPDRELAEDVFVSGFSGLDGVSLASRAASSAFTQSCNASNGLAAPCQGRFVFVSLMVCSCYPPRRRGSVVLGFNAPAGNGFGGGGGFTSALVCFESTTTV